jgi:hypothetical protein
VHFSVLIATGILLVLVIRNLTLALAAVISYLAIIFVHEFGHAAVAHWLGYEVNAIHVGLIHGRCEYEHPDTEWEAALVSSGVLRHNCSSRHSFFRWRPRYPMD